MLLSALSILNHCYRSREVQKQVVHVHFLYQIKSIQLRLKLRRKRSNGRLCSQCCNDTIQPTQRFVITCCCFFLFFSFSFDPFTIPVSQCSISPYGVIN